MTLQLTHNWKYLEGTGRNILPGYQERNFYYCPANHTNNQDVIVRLNDKLWNSNEDVHHQLRLLIIAHPGYAANGGSENIYSSFTKYFN